jgi:hypothetical protein
VLARIGAGCGLPTGGGGSPTECGFAGKPAPTARKTGRPERLPLISTGNISNDALERIVRTHVDDVANALATASFVELERNSLTVHK